MNNLLESQSHKQPIADQYLKTTSGSVLVFTKILEAIAAGIGMIKLVFMSDAISKKIIREIIVWIYQSFYFVLPAEFADAISNPGRYSIIIPVIVLLLIILDGIGVLMMRYSGSGERLVSFVHRIYWIAFLLEIIALIVGMLRFVLRLDDISQALSNNQSVFTAVRSLGIIAWLYFFAALIGLLFYCNYHHDICIVLKAVIQERQSENPVNVKKNRLSGRSGWLAWGAGIWFVLSAILLIFPLLTKTTLISDDTIKELIDIPVMILTFINLIISLISFMKYLSLRICVRNFQRAHK